ncbi:MAG: hypothetical protein C0591_14280, partial [Marinilabiliales bacterium]
VSSLVVGLQETDKQVYFTIGPNPVHDYLNVYFLHPSNEMREVTVTDISGKIILKKNTRNQQLQLNTSSLKNGVYLVSVTDGKDILVKRFIK